VRAPIQLQSREDNAQAVEDHRLADMSTQSWDDRRATDPFANTDPLRVGHTHAISTGGDRP
jgi:hypothetical protein